MTNVGQASILIVDDNAQARESMALSLEHAGFDAAACSSGKECLNLLEQTTKSFQLVITDLQMPGIDGLELIREIRRRPRCPEIVMVTAHASVSTAVDAMRIGAFDYIEKPFNVEQLEEAVGRALKIDAAPEHTCIVGSSSAMRQLRQQIAQVAPTDVTVLVQGESGTGKELVARELHIQSSRGTGPLVSVNCPAMSPQLMESELFGHARGAFTSAEATRSGRFEMAHQGTLFLDEVTEIDFGLQAKLLRVLQERRFEKVGSSETIEVDVRLVAATNRSLQEAVRDRAFREDLFYRLAVVVLEIAPLRERRDDIPELIEHFLTVTANRLHQQRREFSQPAIELCLEHDWPGNVRELENLITRLCVLQANDRISADALKPQLMSSCVDKEPDSYGNLPVGTSLQDMERQLIEQTLEHFLGHREKTAKALGIGVRTLANKLKAYGYQPRARSIDLAA